ncbi:MAG: class I SAM-dependent methyltransferase [Acidiferrobacterales bacterium]
MDRNGWNKRYADKEFVWSADPNQFLVAEARSLPAGRALDLGAGEGRNAVWLAEQGWQVTAVDFSKLGLDKARRLAQVRGVDVDWVLRDVAHYQPRASFYNLVLVCYLHLPQPERRRVMVSASNAVAAKGTFLYIGHDLSNIEHGHGGPQDPTVLLTPQDVVADLPGFEIIKAKVVQRKVSYEPAHGGPGDAVALDTLVRAMRPAQTTLPRQR